MSPQSSWLSLALRPEVLKRSLKTALIVGTALALINHGDAILALNIPVDRALKMAFTYFVPFLVSTSASVGAIRHHEKNQQ